VPDPDSLRVALLGYRGNPFSGGQGVYLRQLSAALVRLGHRVTVFSGQPYPQLEAGIPLVEVPGLDLYRPENPFRTPRRDEFRDWIDALEYARFRTGAFPEPLTFSLRARRQLLARRAEFDVVHDNQCLGWGILGLHRAGLPVTASVHHAVVIDRDFELARLTNRGLRLAVRRWYQFHTMQERVARRLPRLITVSSQSRTDIVERMGVAPWRIRVIPVAVDGALFAPMPEVPRVPGRIFAVASADVPLKGMVPLLHAVAALRRERAVDLVVLGHARSGGDADRTMRELGLTDAVRFVQGIDDAAVVRQYAEAEVAVVPSLYEGFSLPALQAMACGVALVATAAGALPEVVGRHEETALLVPPGDSAALARSIGRLLEDAPLRRRLSEAALQRSQRYSWPATAAATADVYREVIGATRTIDR
jgi:glycosyltransferase involved in cell wall biosynthesis